MLAGNDLFLPSRHNDLPWNIRKFIHNQLQTVNLTYDLRNISPWSKSQWSHTDLNRLRQGRVGAQVSEWSLKEENSSNAVCHIEQNVHFMFS